ARADDVDVVDDARVYRENTFHALAETDLTHRDALAEPGIVSGNHRALERLQALLVALLDFDVDANRVARPKGGNIGPLVLLSKLCQYGVLHGINPVCCWADG